MILLSGLLPYFIDRKYTNQTHLSLCECLTSMQVVEVVATATLGAIGYGIVIVCKGAQVSTSILLGMGYITSFILLRATYAHDYAHCLLMCSTIVLLQGYLCVLPSSTIVSVVLGTVIPICSILTWRHLQIQFHEENLAIIVPFFFSSYLCPFLFILEVLCA